uniref:Proteasome-associated protein ECM29 homolog n=1 Tax=Caenorhabditis japonica TaxID=281687 RepID=A0A8R1HP39_CAEJA
MEVDQPQEREAETAETIEVIHMRLLCANNDTKLQSVSDRHLCDLLDLMGRREDLRSAITEVLNQYNKMVKSNLAIRLPLSRLLQLFESDNVITSTLSLVYLTYTKSRNNDEENLEALPVYLKSLSRRPEDAVRIYDLVSLSLPGLHILSRKEKKDWPALDLSPVGIEVLARVFEALLVFHVRNHEEMKSITDNFLRSANQAPSKIFGLSIAEFLQISKKVFPEELNLTEVKRMILKLLEKEIFDDAVAFPLVVLATAANLNEVVDLAESLLKRLPTETLVNDPKVIAKLMKGYLGSDADAKKPTDPLKVISRNNDLAKASIFPYLTKSRIAATTYMNNIKICVDGCESLLARVQTGALQFLISVLEKMPATATKTLAPMLFQKLKVLIGPTVTNGDSSPPKIQSTFALCGVYRCLAILGNRAPNLILDKMDIVKNMFDSLEFEDTDDVASSIGSCLSTWLPMFLQSEKAEIRVFLKDVIREYITSQRPACRLVSLKYAEALLGEDDMDLRWMLLQASGDSRETIQSEAIRQLEKSLEKPSPPVPLLIGAIWSSLQKDFSENTNENERRAELCFSHKIHQICSKYLYAVLETIVMKGPAHLRIVEGDDHWMTVAPRIVKLMQELNSPEMVQKAAEMTLFAMTTSTDVHLVRIASCFQAAYRSSTINDQPTIDANSSSLQCVQKLRDSTRMEFSNALAYLLSALLHNDQDARSRLFKDSKNDLVEKDIPGLAWVCAAAITPVLGATFKSDLSASELIKTTFLPIINNGYHRPSSTLESTLGAVGFILQNNPIALNHVDHKNTITELIEICEKIAVSRQDSFTQKTRESGTRVIGFLSGNVDSNESEGDDSFKLAIASLNRFGEGPPQQELQLTVGEAIVDAIMGSHAFSKRDFYLLDADEITLAARLQNVKRLEIVNERIVDFINKTLADKKINKNQHFRRAELVWLLVVVQNFGKWRADVLNNGDLLSAVQEAFADGLTENDDFSQDISSKGMGVVYGLADQTLRKKLVESLMTTLTEGKRSEAKVQEDTKIFAKSEMGTTPTGEKLTTYKELLTLASDLNQPDLVYKFMQLARHNAIWNSKMGAAHGFGALLENAKEEIEPYFNQLVPKLYRLRYDPNSKVQAAMKSIWQILTADRKNVVDEFANEIARELLPAITDREYRVRESACLALSDLLRGNDTPEMHRMIPQYLDSVLRVRDDHKESSREAANRAAESIAKLIVRIGSSSNLEKANEFLSIALPAVVDQGILKSSVKANIVFCLKLVLDLTKTAGKQLKPYMAELIPMLMDSISENESQILNYLAVRSTQEQMEMLDDARSSIARTSPMMTAVNDLLPHIDSKVLIDMTPKVCETLRSSVGVSTRSSAAQFVTQLALRAPQLLHDHTAQCDKLFVALIPGVRDRNASIRKQFANSLSYLAKFVSSNQMKKLIKTVVSDLLTNNEDQKIASCHVLSNLAQNSSEMLAGYKTQIIPYVFLEICREVPKGDEDARQKNERWNEVWSELVPSTSAAIRLYKDEILTLAIDMVTNNEVWAVRKQAAVMVGQTFENLKQDAGIETAKKAAFCLLENLNGRIWDGKVEILKALTKIFIAGGDQFKQTLQSNETDEIVKVLRREAAKKNVDYACAGLSTLAAWSVITGDVESAHWLAEKVAENITKLTGNRDGEESDDAMEGLSNAEKEIRVAQLITPNLTALALSLPTFNSAEQAEKSLELVAEYVKNPLIAWKSKQFFFVELAATIEKWLPELPVNASKLVDNLLDEAEEMCTLQRKTVAADALQILLRMQEKSQKFGVDWSSVADRASRGTAGQTTGLANRFESRMETE